MCFLIKEHVLAGNGAGCVEGFVRYSSCWAERINAVGANERCGGGGGGGGGRVRFQFAENGGGGGGGFL